MKGTLDWIGRTMVLVLSAIATLTMLSSLASISGGPIGGLVPRAGEMIPAGPVSDIQPTPPATVATKAEDSGASTANVTEAPARVVTPSRNDEAILWLKALTYAVQALGIVAAVGVIILLRITALLSRIANR